MEGFIATFWAGLVATCKAGVWQNGFGFACFVDPNVVVYGLNTLFGLLAGGEVAILFGFFDAAKGLVVFTESLFETAPLAGFPNKVPNGVADKEKRC